MFGKRDGAVSSGRARGAFSALDKRGVSAVALEF